MKRPSVYCASLLLLLALPVLFPAADRPVAAQDVPVLPGRRVYQIHERPLGGGASPLLAVPVNLNSSRDTLFLLDTGANRTGLAADTAAALHLVPQPVPGPQTLIDGSPQTDVRVTLTFPGFGFITRPLVIDRVHLTPLGPDVDGVLGTSDLHEFAAVFDFARQTLTLVLGGRLTDAERGALGFGRATAIPLAGSNGFYTVDTRLADGPRQASEPLLIDTGSDTTEISGAAAHALDLSPSGPDTLYRGFDPHGYRISHSRAALTVGGMSLADLPVAFPADASTLAVPHLGLDILCRFRVLLDFPAEKIYLVPSTP